MGTCVNKYFKLNLTPTFAPFTTANTGQAIADVTRLSFISFVCEILGPDGVAIGTIADQGFAGGAASPGMPAQQTGANRVIMGGTGAFVGVRGFSGGGVYSGTTSGTPQNALGSVTSDPAYRRINGAFCCSRQVFTIYPAESPTVVAVFHRDFIPVSDAQPATTGEVLSLVVTGLGPTRPGVDPGQPFPVSPLQPVNSPVAVIVNGQRLQAINANGYPETVNQYRVYFQMPLGTPKGPASVQVSAAWITGPAVTINFQ